MAGDGFLKHVMSSALNEEVSCKFEVVLPVNPT